MAKRAGVITISLNAGTSQFVLDMEKAKAKVRDFGQASKFNMAESTAAVKALEGNFGGTTRAVSRFVAVTLGLGPVLSAAFPVIGAVLLGKAIVDTGQKVAEFFKDIRNAPEKVKGAFRELEAPLRSTNDELRVANDRLANDIAKLEGRRQNTLKLALDEARAAADKLAESLDKDIAALNKLLKEQEVGLMRRLLGEAQTKDIREHLGGETGFGGFAARIAGIEDTGNAKIAAAKTVEAQKAARAELDAALKKAYADEISWIDQVIAESDKLQKRRQALISGTGPRMTSAGPNPYGVKLSPAYPDDQTVRLEEARRVRRALAEQSAFVGLQSTNTGLTAQKEALEASRANEGLTRPFEDRMKALAAQLEGVKAKLLSAGWSESAKTIVKGYGEAVKVIEEVNKALEEHHIKLTDAQMGQISLRSQQIASAEAESEWKTKLAQTTAQIADQIRSQELLTAAVGKGYAAVKAAAVESRVMAAVGGERYNDPAFMASRQADIAAIRAKAAAEYEAQHQAQAAEATDKLDDQIKLETRLAEVQEQGALAVRLATLQVKLAKMEEDGATREQIRAELELFEATRKNEAAAGVAKINERIRALRALIAVQAQGAEAERKAALESKYEEMGRSGAAPGEIAAEREKDRLERQREVTAEALKSGMARKDELEQLDLQIAALEKLKAEGRGTLEIEISLRELRNQQLRLLAQQALQLRTIKDGVRAFFLDMQADAKSAGQSLYGGLHSALDRVSGELANLFTRQKTNFGQVFRDLFKEQLTSGIKATLQRGLGALGSVLGIKGAVRRDGNTPDTALYVQVVNGLAGGGDILPGLIGVGSGAGSQSGGPGTIFGGAAGRGIFNILGSALGLTPRAEGGDLSPANAYLVGERGPEILTGMSGQIVSNAAATRLAPSGHTVNVGNIDARGADPARVREAIRVGMTEAYRAAVGTSVQVNFDRGRRVPAKA